MITPNETENFKSLTNYLILMPFVKMETAYSNALIFIFNQKCNNKSLFSANKSNFVKGRNACPYNGSSVFEIFWQFSTY
jgi:hypothetical protein